MFYNYIPNIFYIIIFICVIKHVLLNFVYNIKLLCSILMFRVNINNQ